MAISRKCGACQLMRCLGLILGAGDQIIVCARKEKEDWSAGVERVQFVSGAL